MLILRRKIYDYIWMGTIRKIAAFVRTWVLLFAIMAGVSGYLLYASIPALDFTHGAALVTVEVLQPVLIFSMLFVTFSRVNPRRLRLCRWHWWLLAFQAIMFAGIGAFVISLPAGGLRVVLEGAMICFICPVATAGAVVTRKLGGDASHITTYTILINLVAAVLIPAVVPLVHPQQSMSLWNASMLILGKVFPLLLFPLFLAFLVRRLSPRLHFLVTRRQDLAFWLWVVALFLATAVTTRFIMHTSVSLSTELWLVAVSFVSCVTQFFIGWKVGARYDDRITAGQALGQKNTVLAIWIGYTFFTPITSVCGGFYSIFHNVINSWQLYRHDLGSKKSP